MLKPIVLLVLLLSSAPSFAQSAKCPVINGTFVMITVREDGSRVGHRLVRNTRVLQGLFSYTVDRQGNYQAADGVARSILLQDRPSKVRFYCEEGALVQEAWDDEDKSASLSVNRYRMLNAKQVQVESTIAKYNGVYLKQEEPLK